MRRDAVSSCLFLQMSDRSAGSSFEELSVTKHSLCLPEPLHKHKLLHLLLNHVFSSLLKVLPAPAESFPYELDLSLLFLVTGLVIISSLLEQLRALKVPPWQSSTPRTDTGLSELAKFHNHSLLYLSKLILKVSHPTN